MDTTKAKDNRNATMNILGAINAKGDKDEIAEFLKADTSHAGDTPQDNKKD